MKRFSWKNRITVRISQKNFGKFICECKKEKISLTDIRFIDDSYICTMLSKDLPKAQNAAEESGAEMSSLRKTGAGYFAYIHRKRYGFYIGALVALLILVYLTSCIWVIDIRGNDITPDKDILRVLSKHGIKIGAIRYGKKISDIKNKSLIELDSLAWLWVRIDGTRAIVEVREKGEGEEIYDPDMYTNLVASYPGLICDMRIKHGRKVVNRNDVVSKGDLLVSGISSTKYLGNRYIHSQGEVIAKTWRTLKRDFDTVLTKKVPTGEKYKKRSIEIFGKEIKNIFFGKTKYKNYIKETEKKQLRIFNNIYLPLSFTTETFCEIIFVNETLGEDEAVKRAVDILVSEIESQRHKDARTINTTYDYINLEDGKISVSVTVESEENIAIESKLDIEMLEEDTVGEDN